MIVNNGYRYSFWYFTNENQDGKLDFQACRKSSRRMPFPTGPDGRRQYEKALNYRTLGHHQALRAHLKRLISHEATKPRRKANRQRVPQDHPQISQINAD